MDELKISFTQLIESLKEYSTIEDISNLESVKDEILQLLKTHRPVKLCDYEYGLSRNLKKDGRLIIKELNDISKVREYFYAQGAKNWYCINHFSQRHKCRSSNVLIKYGIVFSPIDHGEICETRDYSMVMKIQDLLKQGKTKEVHGLTSGRGYGKNKSNPSISSSMLNESTLSNAGQDDNSILEESVSFQIPSPVATVTDLSSPSAISDSARSSVKREIDGNAAKAHSSIVEESVSTNSTTASSDSRDTSPFHFPSPVATVAESARSSVKPEINENDEEDCMIIEQPAAKKPKVEEESHGKEIFEFHRPSTFILKQTCKKLKIDVKSHAHYNNAYEFWATIIFQNILSITSDAQTHSFKSSNIFACLSLLFTGKTDSCFLIQHVINDAFRNDLIATGTKTTEEIEQLLINTVASDEQIEFIAKFMSCRIGIYYESVLKKFGEWQQNCEEEDILTLLFSFEAGCFSIVLNFS